MSTTEATVEVLTAEVRTLVVGARQVTLSVFRQLDMVVADHIEPFGRVRDTKHDDYAVGVDVVGKSTRTGTLVRAWCPDPYDSYSKERLKGEDWLATVALYEEYRKLPLVVLAGLR